MTSRINIIMKITPLFIGLCCGIQPQSCELFVTLANTLDSLTTNSQNNTEISRKFNISSELKNTRENANYCCFGNSDVVEFCIQLSALSNDRMNRFIEECLSVTDDIKIFRKATQAMLDIFDAGHSENSPETSHYNEDLTETSRITDSKYYRNYIQSDISIMPYQNYQTPSSRYIDFINALLNNDHQKIEYMLRKITNQIRGGSMGLLYAVCSGIKRLAMISEDIEYTLKNFTLGSEENMITKITICARPLKITPLVMKYHFERKLGLDIVNVTSIIFKNVFFLPDSNIFDFIFYSELPRKYTVEFHCCKFTENLLKISDFDAFIMQNVIKMNMKSCHITNIENSILKLSSLKYLELLENPLKKIPDAIFGIHQLEELTINNSEIMDVPIHIKHLVHLKKLSLCANSLSDISFYITTLTNLNMLSVSMNRIKNIPDELLNLKNLSILNVSHNKITNLTLDFTKLPLKALYIGNNPIDVISRSIYNIKTLTHLSLRFIGITELPTDFHREMTNLKVLVLSGNHLVSLNPIQHFTKLKELHLEHCRLKKLPNEIRNLSNLTKFYLSGNDFDKIPKCIFSLIQLKLLDLSKNNLTRISWRIKKLVDLVNFNVSSNLFQGSKALSRIAQGLPKLQVLSVSSNRIVSKPEWVGQNPKRPHDKPQILGSPISIPDNFGRLQDLVRLDMRGSYMDKIPNSLCELRSLENLDLCANNISALPRNTRKLVKLKTVDLSSNKLFDFPEFLRGMKLLTFLSMRGNSLVVIPAWMGELTNLEHLNLQQNQICRIPESIDWSMSLRTVYIGQNKLQLFPVSFMRCRAINEIDIRINMIGGQVPSSIGNLINARRLAMSSNNFTKLPKSISNMASLMYVNVSNNSISEIPEELFYDRRTNNIKHLTHIDFSNNEIKEIPDAIAISRFLEQANVSQNQICKLPDNIGYLPNLKTLMFDNNQVKVLPQSIGALKSIIKLSCNDNQIKFLPDEIGKLSTLRILNIRNNEMTAKLPPSFSKLELNLFQFTGNRIPNILYYSENYSKKSGKFKNKLQFYKTSEDTVD